MRTTLEYEELRIRVRRLGTGRYLVAVNGPTSMAGVLEPGPDAAGFRAKLDRLITVELGEAPTNDDHMANRLRELGRELFQCLLGGPVAEAVDEAFRRVRRQRPQRALRLRFDLPPELDELPVEALATPSNQAQGMLALNYDVSPVRSLPGDLPWSRLPDPASEPSHIRLLVAVASPAGTGLPPLQAGKEIAELRRELPEAVVKKRVVLGVTRRKLEDALDDQADHPTAVLLIAHGRYDPERGEGVVFLETEDGGPDPVPAQLLSGILAKARQLRLVALNICAGADGARLEPFSGLAQALVGRGVPAVVAMRGRISDLAAARFSPVLLDGVAKNKTIDESVTTARRYISDLPGHTTIEWTTPVLFVHEDCTQGRLFKAREIRAGREPTTDPLREGSAALRHVRDLDGHLSPDDFIAAARFLRAQGKWDDARELLQPADLRELSEEHQCLYDEALVELSWPSVDALCSAVATEQNEEEAGRRLDELRATTDELWNTTEGEKHPYLSCLAAEVDALRRLTGLLEEARKAESCEDWSAALRCYGEVLAERPLGFRDVRERQAAAHEALRRNVHEQARRAEEAGDWPAAIAAYEQAPDVPGSATRAVYARGRAAAADGDWPGARDAFVQAVDLIDDPDGDDRALWAAWRDYAAGRAAEHDRLWDEAAALYEQTSGFLDSADRVLYVRGRKADACGDWQGVIDGFARLGDPFEDGDVGRRRLFARARLAVGRADWASVLALLADMADADRDGAVGLLRRKARAGQAEAAGDWGEAAALYAPYADSAEFRDPHLYARARAHEAHERWDEALAAFEELPDGYEDAPLRRGYVRARLAEQHASAEPDWRAIADAYKELPEDFADVPKRACYARARSAELKGDWTGAAEETDALGAYRDAPVLGDYARARLAEADHDWPRAADLYRRCAGRRDADGRGAFAEGRVLEAAGRWSAALDAYTRVPGHLDAGEGHGEDLRGRAEACVKRLRWLLDGVPWADGLADMPLIPDPCALRDPTFPYLALKSAGISAGSSTDVVNDAAFALLERGAMTWPARVAWDELRLPAKRLRLDAMLYEVRDPPRLRERLAELTPDDGPDLLDVLCRRSPDEVPLLLLLARGRDDAIAAWEERLHDSPGDMTLVHALAVAHLWQARELDESGAWEHSVRAWEQSLAYWATVLYDDAHWDRWMRARAVSYERPVASGDVARLQTVVEKALFELLAGYERRHAQQGQTEQGQAYQALIDRLEIELRAARELKDVGGLPAGRLAEPLVCGPGYLRMAGLEMPFAELLRRLDREAEEGRDPGRYAVRMLRWFFSELATASSFFWQHRFDDALRALPVAPGSLTDRPGDCAGKAAASAAHVRSCEHCGEFLTRSPAYALLSRRRARLIQDSADLAVRAHLALAQIAITRADLERTLSEFAAALRVSRGAGMEVRTQRAAARMVLGRIEALSGQRGSRRGAGLDEAVTLLERAKPVIGSMDGDLLARYEAGYAEVLAERGVWRGSECTQYDQEADPVSGEDDLRRALAINPTNAYARDNLARALVFSLDGRRDGAGPAEKLAVLLEALAILHAGLLAIPTHRWFVRTLGRALEALETVALGELDYDRLSGLIQEVGGDLDSVDDRTERAWELIRKAGRMARHGDQWGALYQLIRAVRLAPDDDDVRDALLTLLRTRQEPEGTDAS
ncbi:CHAT domain-containing protein [Actinomadura sp. 3N508]|uniref:CHAT domain-containing protein n=1 Tax=Actinomadura sp. 3N508 TaxID=3375153 RepID=UPI0037AFFC10